MEGKLKITKIECVVLLVPDYDPEAGSSAQDDIVVFIHTDEGITGIGEVDTNPWVAKAMIEAKGTHNIGQGLTEMLLGQDPLQPERLWERMYMGSLMTGRRGLGICAMGALDMALWDIRGKALGQPCWKLLGGAKKDFITPYASLLPTGRTVKDQRESLVSKVNAAKVAGFTAAKLEVMVNGPYAHNGVQESNASIVEIVAACREAVGKEFVIMVDVCYGWATAKEALGVMTQLESYDLFFMETPIRIDDLDGYRFLSEHSPIPIASGEMLNTRFEFQELMDRGKVDVVQPDVGRVGGFTEAKRVCDMAADRGKLIVPHCWKTGIGIAASAHLAVATTHCPYIEFLPAHLAESVLRSELTLDELRLVEGKIPLPTAAGLGIQLNPEALKKYRVN
jgi:L-alanine-DL-glutamate epimerase-like enolase superfamily enzyme